MDNITAVGIDLSKNIFHLHGTNHADHKYCERKFAAKLCCKSCRSFRKVAGHTSKPGRPRTLKVPKPLRNAAP